jgi:short-subunit dehydrogenase
MRIEGAVALVTGASSGIGEATAARLASAGAQVLVHGRDESRTAAVAERIGGTPLVADLSLPRAGEKLAEAAGRVDLLVNNAGLGWAGPAAELSGDELATLVAVNLTAPIALTNALLPQFLARGSGSLVFVCSIAGRLGVAGEAAYAGTKAGLDVFAESLRLELSGTGIRVGVLVPGVVQTAFFDRRNRPYQRGRPKPLPVGAAADALLRLVLDDRAEQHVPRWLRVPIAVRGSVPGVYRYLGARFGG